MPRQACVALLAPRFNATDALTSCSHGTWQVKLDQWHISLRGMRRLQGKYFREQRVVITSEVLALGEPGDDTWDDVIPLNEIVKVHDLSDNHLEGDDALVFQHLEMVSCVSCGMLDNCHS